MEGMEGIIINNKDNNKREQHTMVRRYKDRNKQMKRGKRSEVERIYKSVSLEVGLA
jgi:hypothetical protein